MLDALNSSLKEAFGVRLGSFEQSVVTWLRLCLTRNLSSSIEQSSPPCIVQRRAWVTSATVCVPTLTCEFAVARHVQCGVWKVGKKR